VTVGDARSMFLTSGHGAYPLVDRERRVTGIVTRGDLLRSQVADQTPVEEISSSDVVTVHPSAQLLDVVALMLDEDVEHVPVVDGTDTLLGICTRTDLLRARGPSLAGERRQRGWLRGSGSIS
jgi:chloride channel protein, CIC family